MKQNLTLIPLEPYKARYTLQLRDWEYAAFSEKFAVDVVEPNIPVQLDIHSGEVLDRTMRPRWALAQNLQILNRLDPLELAYFSDMYHPGIDALLYAGKIPNFSMFCWAQTFDCYDFTAKKMMEWMRPYELMVISKASQIFVADPLLADLILTAIPGISNKVFPVGLPFNSAKVKATLPESEATVFEEPIDVVYTSRFDEEKNPWFFLKLVEHFRDLSFAVCTGRRELVGEPNIVAHAKTLPNLRIYTDLSKKEYYNILQNSRIQFNCASQDWVSYTLLEGLCFGCFPLYPMFRSFPRALISRPEHLYAHLDLDDAVEHIEFAMANNSRSSVVAKQILQWHDGSLRRIASMIR